MKHTVKSVSLAALLAASASGAAMAGDFAAANYTTDLSGVCPDPLIVQLDWLPQAEQGGIWQMIGEGGEMTPGSYQGPLGSTGIDLQILSGGGGIGLGDGETAYSALFMGNSKAGVMPHLGYQELDSSFIFSKRFPTVGVFAPLDVAPTVLFWDAATYPDGFSSIEDLAALADNDDAKIYVSTVGRTFGKYLVDSGVPKEVFVEGYKGDGENFVTNNGQWLNQGFVTSEVYKFENGLNWEKPIDFLKIDDLGYRNYTGIVSVATSRLEELSPCLTGVVPIMQQAAVDYAADPAETNATIVAFNDAEMATSWWKTAPDLMEYAAETMVAEGVIGNGSDDTVGNFDMERVAEMLEIVTPSLDERSEADVTPEMVVTNQFIDPSIGLE